MDASRFLPGNLSDKLSKCLRQLPIIPEKLRYAKPANVRELDGLYVITFLLNNGTMMQDFSISKLFLTRGMFATQEDMQMCFKAINDALDYMNMVRNWIKQDKEFWDVHS